MAASHTRRRRLEPIPALLGLAVFAAVLLILGTAPAAAIPTETVPVQLYGAVQGQVDSLTVQAGFVQAEIDALDDELELRAESHNRLAVELGKLNVRMAGLRRDLKSAEAEHTACQKRFDDRLCALYKSGGRNQLLQILVLADGMEDLYKRIRLVSTLADQDIAIIADLEESTAKLDTVLAEIDRHKGEQLAIRRQMNDMRADIQAKMAERQAALVNIDGQIATIMEQERLRQLDEQERVKQALKNLISGNQKYVGPLPLSDDATVNQFMETATFYLGIPYVWAGDRPSTGFDCSGFTSWVYAQHGVYLPHYSGYQAQMGYPVDPGDIQPGDLLAFGAPVRHVGIYLGNDFYIHAPRTGDVIKISHLSERTNLSFIRRFVLEPRIGAPAIG